MPPKRVRIHYHRPGRGTVIFHEDLVLDRPDAKVTLLREYQGRAAHAGPQRILDPGAPVVWFVFPELWRDVGRFHLSDGTFTGWYTNLRGPLTLNGDDWSCTDLFLDHWMPADGSPPMWLDEQELTAAGEAGAVTSEQLHRMAEERATVDRLVTAGEWPPVLTKQVTLMRALQLLQV
jgi:predicted RNA-binding protein associated with RNAse of E/G family